MCTEGPGGSAGTATLNVYVHAVGVVEACTRTHRVSGDMDDGCRGDKREMHTSSERN